MIGYSLMRGENLWHPRGLTIIQYDQSCAYGQDNSCSQIGAFVGPGGFLLYDPCYGAGAELGENLSSFKLLYVSGESSGHRNTRSRMVFTPAGVSKPVTPMVNIRTRPKRAAANSSAAPS